MERFSLHGNKLAYYMKWLGQFDVAFLERRYFTTFKFSQTEMVIKK